MDEFHSNPMTYLALEFVRQSVSLCSGLCAQFEVRVHDMNDSFLFHAINFWVCIIAGSSVGG